MRRYTFSDGPLIYPVESQKPPKNALTCELFGFSEYSEGSTAKKAQRLDQRLIRRIEIVLRMIKEMEFMVTFWVLIEGIISEDHPDDGVSEQ